MKYILILFLLFFSFITYSQTLPNITSQPTNQTVTVGQTVTFIVEATCSGPLGFQWWAGGSKQWNNGDKNGRLTVLNSTNTSMLTIENTNIAEDSNNIFVCEVKNLINYPASGYWINSNTATLKVIKDSVVYPFPDNAVDWILVELRANPDSGVVNKQAVILLSNGEISTQSGDTVKYGVPDGEYHVVVYHRNHLPIMSRYKIKFKDSYMQSYLNFTNNPDSVYGGIDALAEVDTGVYAMIAGDTNADFVVNVLDYKPIYDNLFKIGYYNADTNMDGIVNILDYALVSKNLFRASQVPIVNISSVATKLKIIKAVSKDSSQLTTLPFRAYDGIKYSGDVNQIWTSNPIPEWIYFELDSSRNVKQIKMSFSYFHTGRVYEYSIEYSNDKVNWTTAILSVSSIANQEWVSQNLNFRSKYIRISITSNNQSNWAGFYEVEIYGN